MRGDFRIRWPLGPAICGLAMGAVPALAQDADALAACQLIEDSTERLACYDEVLKPREAPPAEPVAAEPEPEPELEPEPARAASPAPEPAALAEKPPEPAPAAATPALSDDIGQESISNAKRDELAVRGRLAKCQQGRSGKYVFWFDNGQIWRQKGNTTPKWKDCTFEVTIGKDMFGYTMVRDGETRKYRVERVE